MPMHENIGQLNLVLILHNMASLRAAFTLLACLAWTPGALSFTPSTRNSADVGTRLRLVPPPPPDISTGSRSFYEGLPSSPGWKSGQLEAIVEWAVTERANRPIISEYDPDPLWLWTRWNGTVLKLALVPVVFNICFAICVDISVHHFAESSWPVLSIPPAEDPMIQQLEGLNKLWGYQVTLTTFILTFFTGMLRVLSSLFYQHAQTEDWCLAAEAYKHWKCKCT